MAQARYPGLISRSPYETGLSALDQQINWEGEGGPGPKTSPIRARGRPKSPDLASLAVATHKRPYRWPGCVIQPHHPGSRQEPPAFPYSPNRWVSYRACYGVLRRGQPGFCIRPPTLQAGG